MDLGLPRLETGSETKRDQFDLATGVVIAVTALMCGVKARGEVILFLTTLLISSPDIRGSERHVEFVALAAIAEVKTPFILWDAAPLFCLKFLLRHRFELAKFFVQLEVRR